MDNDNLLVQKAADLYRGLRFKMKYRGVPILSAGAGNDLARDLLESGQPFLFGRCGATEMRTAADYLHNGGRPFADRTRADIRNLSGVFPTDDAALERFCKLYIRTAQSAELLALWNVGAEREVIRGCDATRFTELRALEPYYHTRPWSAALAGKRVLVVHPFRKTILSQYEKRAQLFPVFFDASHFIWVGWLNQKRSAIFYLRFQIIQLLVIGCCAVCHQLVYLRIFRISGFDQFQMLWLDTTIARLFCHHNDIFAASVRHGMQQWDRIRKSAI